MESSDAVRSSTGGPVGLLADDAGEPRRTFPWGPLGKCETVNETPPKIEAREVGQLTRPSSGQPEAEVREPGLAEEVQAR